MAALIVGAFTACVVVVFGANSPAALRKFAAPASVMSVSAGSTLGVDVPSGAAVCDCATGGCVLDDGAAMEVGPSSGSVDVDVFVRYNAVWINCAGEAHVAIAPHFHTPRPGNISCILMSPPHTSKAGMKVQPLGSSIILTPISCTSSGRRGWDGKAATAPVGAMEHVGVPSMVVDRVPVHD